MAHDHAHTHHGTRNIKYAFLINLGFTFIELVGGILTNSVAILSDALHDLGDSVGLGLAWFLERVSHKKRDTRFTYGYRRFSLLSAYINSIILIVGSMLILYISIPRLFNPMQPDLDGMFFLAILGIVFNGISAFKLRSGATLNQRVVSWHLMEDVLGWVAILIISVVMRFWSVPILDPAFSILITVIILFGVFKNFQKTLKIFLQAKPDNIEVQELEELLVAVAGVNSVHDTHLWTMDGDYLVMTVHVVVDDGINEEHILRIKSKIKEIVREWKIQHITIEIEYEREKCALEDC